MRRCYPVAAQFGCKRMIYVKDEDGLYTANPKTAPHAKFIPKISIDAGLLTFTADE